MSEAGTALRQDHATVAPFVPCPDMAIAARHIERLTGAADTPVRFRLIHDDKTIDTPKGGGFLYGVNDQGKPRAGKLYGSLSECWPDIEAAQQAGYGAFLVVNDGGDTDAEITRVRALFVDADGIPLAEEWEWHAKPDFVIQRDDTHWHGYWSVRDLPVDQFRQCQQRLAAHYKTDPSVSNPSRIMRLAGTLHLKDRAAPKSVTLRETRPRAEPVRNVVELMDGIPDAPVVPTPSQPSPITGNPITPTMLRDMLAHIDPTFDGGSEQWVGIGKAVRYGQIPLTEPQEENWWIDLLDDWCSGELWRKQTGDDVFTVATYQGREELLSRLGDRPRENSQRITLGTIIKLANEGSYRGPIDTGAGVFRELAETKYGATVEPVPKEAEQEAHTGRSKFRGIKPSEGAKRPKPSFWDTDKTLPRYAAGCRVIAVAPPSEHKTNLVLAKVLDAIRDHGARVLFVAGEAVDDLLTERIPAQCAVRGITVESLDDSLGVGEVCPLLTSPDEVDAFIAEHKSFNPDFVVLDTLSEAMTGEDENSAEVASRVMAEAGRIRKAFNCMVILIHHLGKDKLKGVRGSSVFRSGADAVWEISYDRNAGTVKQHVDKMRRGRAKFDVWWGTTIVRETMTVIPMTKDEAAKAEAKTQQDAGGSDHGARAAVVEALAQMEADEYGSSVSTRELAERLIGDPKCYANENAWRTELLKKVNWLENKCRDRTAKNGRPTGARPLLAGLCDMKSWPPNIDNGRLMRRWFLPEGGNV